MAGGALNKKYKIKNKNYDDDKYKKTADRFIIYYLLFII